MNSGILVWDSPSACPSNFQNSVLWRDAGLESNKSTVSIPRLVEENATTLRSRYLEWVYELGEQKINEISVVESLKMQSGLSYWWLTQLSEKQNINLSPGINDAIKLMAFEMWAEDETLNSVTLSSNNKLLVACLQSWCESKGIPFLWVKNNVITNSVSFARRTYKLLPNVLQALGYLGHYLYRYWCLCGVGVKKWKESKAELTFFSYFLNLDEKKAKLGQFQSAYWGELPTELKDQRIGSNWLHRYVDHTMVSSPREAKTLIESFNDNKNSNQAHVMLESFLSLKLVFNAMLVWVRLIFLTRNFEKSLSKVNSKGLWLWPLFRDDWKSSRLGSRAIMILVTDGLMRASMRGLPEQSLGVYLYEQQPWELSLIHAWKAAGHGSIVGSQHATMLFWDLRYYHHSRNYSSCENGSLPMPDNLAVNGPVTEKICLDSGYPASKLVEVEALRYLTSKIDDEAESRVGWTVGSEIRLLVLTDYSPQATQSQLLQLENSLQYFGHPISILVKPHPNFMVNSLDYPALKFVVTMRPIAELLGQCNVVFCSAMTSAAVEVYIAGLPLVSAKSNDSLNLSPLREIESARFASTPCELHSEIMNALNTSITKDKREDFYIIDPTLSRWKTLLRKYLTAVVIR